MIEDIQKWKDEKYRILILCSTLERKQRVMEEIRENDILVASATQDTWPEEIPVLVDRGQLQTGFIYRDEKIAVIAESDIAFVKARKRPRAVQRGKRISSFTDLKIGDYVVHQTHGIGVYNGIEQLKVEGVRKDYLKISYKDGGLLYIPTTNMDLIQKYIGSEGKRPRLNKLGGLNGQKPRRKSKNLYVSWLKILFVSGREAEY